MNYEVFIDLGCLKMWNIEQHFFVLKWGMSNSRLDGMGTDGCQDGHCLDTMWNRKGEKTTQTGTPLHSWKHSDWCADINMINECKYLYKNVNDRQPANSGESMATMKDWCLEGELIQQLLQLRCDAVSGSEAQCVWWRNDRKSSPPARRHELNGVCWGVMLKSSPRRQQSKSIGFKRGNVTSTANLQLAVTLATRKLFSPPSEFPRTWLRPWWISPGSQSVRRCAVCRWIFDCGLQKGSAHGPRHIGIVLSRAPRVLCASRCCLICFIPPAGSASAELWKMSCPVPLELETLTATSHSCWNTGRYSELHWSPPDQRVAVEVPCTAWKE